MKQSNTERSNPLAPPRGELAKAIARRMGPASSTLLRQIASFAESEPSWVYGHVTAEQLRMLAQELDEPSDVRLAQREAELDEERQRNARLRSELERLAREITEAEQCGEPTEVTIMLVSQPGDGVLDFETGIKLVNLLHEVNGR